MDTMNSNLSAVLFDESELRNRIRELGTALSRDYADKKPVLVCILKGAVIFLADLMRHITIPIEVDFMAISSYGSDTVSSGVIKLKKDIEISLQGRCVIIVEDIVDTGLSLQYLVKHLSEQKPLSVATCTLLNKQSARKVEVNIDYVGFEIEDEFVVGFGLDYNERYRNLPYIGILKEEVYS